MPFPVIPTCLGDMAEEPISVPQRRFTWRLFFYLSRNSIFCSYRVPHLVSQPPYRLLPTHALSFDQRRDPFLIFVCPLLRACLNKLYLPASSKAARPLPSYSSARQSCWLRSWQP